MNTAPTNRITELDGLRGVAIMLVLWHHLIAPYLPLGPTHWLGWVRAGSTLAWCGVDLFFVLSGYFIGGILIDRRDSPQLARVFYVRRATRILPLYYVTLAACLASVALGWIGPPSNFGAWIYSLFLTNFALAWQNNWEVLALSVLWSIAVEEQFYLTAPWVVRWISAARLPWLLVALIFTAELARVILKWNYPQLHVGFHVLTPLRMDSLAYGALVAWAVRAPAARPFFHRLSQTWPAWLAAAFLLLGALAVSRPGPGDSLTVYVGYSVISASFALIVAIVAGVRPPGLNRLLALPPLAHLGRHSYFVYLWHGLIGWWVVHWLGGPNFEITSIPGLTIPAAGIGATWLAGIVSWEFLEARFITLGHHQRY